MRITFSTEARRDRHEAAAGYGMISRGLRHAFTRDLDAALQYLLEYPLGAAIRERDIRGKRLMHFPYTILYRVVGRHIFVLTISHQARDPESYAARFD